MNAFVHLCRWEVRRLMRTGTARATLGLLFVAGLLALGAADREIDRQAREIASLDAHYASALAVVAEHHAPRAHAGEIAYYTFFPTHHAAPALAKLSLGLRDLVPAAVWVRLLGLEGQLYTSAIGNPAVQALGPFDLAFVVCALAPLALLLLAHDLLSRDRDHGLLPLALTQAASLPRLFAARLLVRAAAVAAVCVALWVIALLWLALPLNLTALAWLADALLHLACWTAIAGLIAATCRSLSASLATAGTVWVGAVVVLPALLNLAVATAYPVPEGLALTVRQRQETHAGWDRPKPETFAQFFRTHPEWRDTAPVTGRFAWKWYYAMHQVGDTSVAADAAIYRAHLLARAAATERLGWFVPPVAAQLLLSRRAGTDLESHLAYLDRIRTYHAQLQDHFLPLVFAEREITPADYAAFPRFRPALAPASAGTVLERLPLLLATLALAALSLRAVRRVTP